MTFRFQIMLVVIQIILITSLALLWAQVNELSSQVTSSATALEGAQKTPVAAQNYVPNHICTARTKSSDWCESDFTRLSSFPDAAQGKHLRIAGYLAIDNGIVTLFASEDDYKNMMRGQSIEVKGTRAELTRLVSKFGYSNVRLEGKFDVDHRRAGRAGRLGVLLPPVQGQKIYPREAREGVDDIAVDIGYIEPSN